MKKIETNSLILSILIVICIVLGAGTLFFTHHLHNLIDNIHECKDIGLFYTGNGFWEDAINLTETAYMNCDGERDTLFTMFYRYTPKDILNCTGKPFDCEDLAFNIGCLAKEYNISCQYYTYYGINTEAHRGIKCQTELGNYIEVN
jgi:hypothetical protein